MKDQWKLAPVSFEAYWWLCEWLRKGWDIDSIIDETLEWHISSFNPKSIPIPYDWQDKCEYLISRMGYYFTVDSFAYPESAARGDLAAMTLQIDNVGVAPAYNEMPLCIRLKSGDNVHECCANAADVRQWLPGKHTVQLRLDIPENLATCKYDIEIGLMCEHAPVVYLATNAERDGGFYKVGQIVIE